MRGGASALVQALTVSGAVWMSPAEALTVQKSSHLAQLENSQHVEGVAESLALSPSFLASGISSEVSYTLATDDGTLICAISSEGQPCRNRQLHTNHGYITGASCPNGLCCSKTMCGAGGCGEFCSSSWVFCSTGLIYHADKSYGGDCSCEKQQHQCHKDAECVEDLNAGGSVRCRCKDGFMGDGKTCKPDPCQSRGNEKCGSNGSCIVVDANRYTCACGEGEVLEPTLEGGYSCKKTGCNAYSEYCNPGRCIDDASQPSRYTCECPQDSWRTTEGKNPMCYPTCEEMGGKDKCGPGSCRAIGKDKYACDCPAGYSRSMTSQSEEKCVQGAEASLAERCEKELGISLSASNAKCDCSKCGTAR
ncbi:putative microneme protein MIC3 [Neospora caninum Liverpool]|uniref:Microneme protein MIC3, putative n=1 Tax=Neospora caninum (strain Liverpool) TaxID=572307 RepID=F0VAA2_NEOCL|nr:putative microneme protein MIC3 [Neospora caninum Liverpool]CBZ50591.1 putative microneme protein MIC3 [Neospora caninum Liverpool]CEL65204.1 TPA: microneme protein MIC3, putative [Neospora caninum Liverpool]|eukprot:XP_003880624.1 putative microneme protein MIC3 [Neospora caninum Liverpool]